MGERRLSPLSPPSLPASLVWVGRSRDRNGPMNAISSGDNPATCGGVQCHDDDDDSEDVD